MGTPLLEVVNLGVKYGTLQAVNDVSFTLETGRILGIVGESGLGKSTLPWALTRLLPEAAALNSGGVWFDGVDLLRLPSERLRALRGCQISYISQDPMQEQLDIAILLITLNMAVVRHTADRAVVLLKGQIIETGPTAAIFAGARDPYTRALIAAAQHAIPEPESL